MNQGFTKDDLENSLLRLNDGSRSSLRDSVECTSRSTQDDKNYAQIDSLESLCTITCKNDEEKSRLPEDIREYIVAERNEHFQH
jgi:hypothetical protein